MLLQSSKFHLTGSWLQHLLIPFEMTVLINSDPLILPSNKGSGECKETSYQKKNQQRGLVPDERYLIYTFSENPGALEGDCASFIYQVSWFRTQWDPCFLCMWWEAYIIYGTVYSRGKKLLWLLFIRMVVSLVVWNMNRVVWDHLSLGQNYLRATTLGSISWWKSLVYMYFKKAFKCIDVVILPNNL